eukprot:2922600-Karenia_brevis.AAC.1
MATPEGKAAARKGREQNDKQWTDREWEEWHRRRGKFSSPSDWQAKNDESGRTSWTVQGSQPFMDLPTPLPASSRDVSKGIHPT